MKYMKIKNWNLKAILRMNKKKRKKKKSKKGNQE